MITIQSTTQASAHTDYTEAGPGDIEKSRSCSNCFHLERNVDADEHPNGVCGRYGWDLLDENIARCTGHATPGEQAAGLRRPSQAMDAPAASGTSAAFLDSVADMLSITKDGDTESPEFLNSMCKIIELAPQSYFDNLEAQQVGAAAEWRKWAINHRALWRDQQDQLNYPAFFEGLRKIGEAVDLHGKEAVHGNAEYADLFADLILCAPPRYRAAADSILAPLIPKLTHVNDDGEPVFTLAQLSESLGVPTERLRAFADEHLDPAAMYRGNVYPIQ